MSGIRVYFMEIIDLNGGKHQIKSTDYQKIWDFVKRHKGEIKALHSGSKTVSEKKFEEMKNTPKNGVEKENFK